MKRVLVPAAGVALALGAGAWARPDRMLVEHVAFEGADRAGAAELRHLADVRNGTTMWGVDTGAIRRGVERHPWVRSATVERRWPDTVHVAIEEYEPVALLRHDALYYVARDGVVFGKADPSDLDYPILSGVRDLDRLHPDLPGLVVHDALWLVDELGTVFEASGVSGEQAGRDVISEVAFSRTRGFTVTLLTGAELLFDVSGLPEQVDRLVALQGEGVDLRRPVFVDLGPASVAIVRELIPAPGARRAPGSGG